MRRGGGIDDEVERFPWAFIALASEESTTSSAPRRMASSFFPEIGGELHRVRAERVGKLERHVAQAAEADDAYLFAGADLPVAQRRVSRDAGASSGATPARSRFSGTWWAKRSSTT